MKHDSFLFANGALSKALMMVSTTLVLTACGGDNGGGSKAPLQAIETSATVDEDLSINGNVTAANAEGSLEFFATRYPEHGELLFNIDGQYTYRPNENYNGLDSFTFYAKDSRGYSNIASVAVTVNPINYAPVANEVVANAYSTEILTLNLSGYDADGDSLTYSLLEQPTNGSASVTENGQLTYQANSPYTGTDTLRFNVSDASGASGEGLVTIKASRLPVRFESEVSEWTVEKNDLIQGTLFVENLSGSALTLPLVQAPEWLDILTDVNIMPHSRQGVSFSVDTRDMDTSLYAGVITYATGQHEGESLSHIFALSVTDDITPPNATTNLSVSAGELYDEAALTWTAQGDNGRDIINADHYEVRYAQVEITEENWNTATLIENPPTPQTGGIAESFNINGLPESSNLFFALRIIDEAGNQSALSNLATLNTPSAPVAAINPTSIVASIAEGRTEVIELTLTNNGSSPLVYSSEVETAATPSAFNTSTTSQKVAMPPINAKAVAASSGNIIVKLQPNLGASLAVNSVLSANQLSIASSVNKLNLQVIDTKNKSAQDIADTINALNQMPEVIYAEPDYLVHAIATPDDARYSDQWALNNEGQTGGTVDADIDAPETWDRFTSGNDVVVAVIDTGVKYDHEDLAANIWTNSGEIPNNGIDDDANGFVDDVHGYDFVNSDGDPMDDNDHGTHCAGIIGADTNNGIGIAGTVHNAKIMAVKFLSASGSGSTSAAIDSVIYAVDNGATVLSNSWGGGGFSQSLQDAIEYAHENDVLFIAAAGNDSSNNDNSPQYPANYDVANVISVASTTHTDGLSNFSNYGATTVDLGAPGSDILSTVSNGGYAVFSGTSMATPYVSGAAVMLRSNFPQLSALEVKEILFNTVDPISALDGKSVTGGRLNLQAALNEAAQSTFVSIPENSTGQLAAGASIVLPVSVNTLDKHAGTYENTIRFSVNNPTTPEFTVPVIITVLPDDTPPAAVTDLTVTTLQDTQATVSWTNTGDDGTTGNADVVHLAWSTTPITTENWDQANIVTDISAGNTGTTQHFVLSGLAPATDYYFAVKVLDSSGEVSSLSNVASAQTLTGSRINLSAETINPVTLAHGNTTTRNLDISNTGDMTLSYRLQLSEPESSTTKQATLNTLNKSVEIGKGELDYRDGDAVTLGRGGPDVYGYMWQDSDEGAVQYDWQDISATGTAMTFIDDSVRGPFQISFDFPFYDGAYNQVWVSSNGFVSFTSTNNNGCCSGQPIPSMDEINNIIAWAWKDLYPSSGYSAHYLAEADKFTIQFANYGEYARNGRVTAQIILHSNGTIKLQYQSFSSGFETNRATVGIENEDGSDGLQVVHNASYLHDELAIEFKPSFSWIRLNQEEGEIAPNDVETDTITLDFNTDGLIDGMYEADLIINHNDPSRESIQIPLQLNVVSPE